VQRIAEDSIEAVSTLVSTEQSYYIEGITKVEEQLIILLDLDRALSDEAQVADDAQHPTADAVAA
jgi:chemotaxis signal transduction protein